MHVCLCTACGCFCATRAALSSCDRTYDPQNLKLLLFGPLRKFADLSMLSYCLYSLPLLTWKKKKHVRAVS